MKKAKTPNTIRRHARKRFRQRDGGYFGAKLERQMVLDIQRGRATFLRQSDTHETRSMWRVLNNRYVVVYSSVTERIVTVLTCQQNREKVG